MRVDIHQHAWPDLLVEALRRRSRPPRLDGWTLLTAAEPPFEVNPADHDIARRARQTIDDGTDLAIIGLSSPLGIEYLPADEAEPLLDAYHCGVAAFGRPFAGWAAAGLRAIDVPGLAKQLDRGFLGLQLPATAVCDEAGYRRCGPLLELLAERELPLFIHPGPVAEMGAGTGSAAALGAGGPADGLGAVMPAAGLGAGGPADGLGAPGWWAALVPYVQQLHAAWFAFRAYGRPAYPGLRVCFAALAGLGPLHGERLAARGGTDPLARGVVDPLAYVETSSYGGRAVDAVLRVLGVDLVIHGSDRPYAHPCPDLGLGEAACHAIRVTNPARLLARERQPESAHLVAGKEFPP